MILSNISIEETVIELVTNYLYQILYNLQTLIWADAVQGCLRKIPRDTNVEKNIGTEMSYFHQLQTYKTNRYV